MLHIGILSVKRIVRVAVLFDVGLTSYMCMTWVY
jgi:hypothetical protein